MSPVLRLTLLTTDILEAILEGRQPEGMQLEGLLEGFQVDWEQGAEDGRQANVLKAKSCPRNQNY